MCYSLRSSLETSAMAGAAILYLYRSNIPKFKWIAATLFGWCAMQFAEALLWATNPSTDPDNCSIINKLITLTIIPLVLMAQPLGSLWGSLYIIPWKKSSAMRKNFLLFYTILIILTIVILTYKNIGKSCTIISPDGHLNWHTTKKNETYTSKEFNTFIGKITNSNPDEVLSNIWVIIIGLPFAMYSNSLLTSAIMFIIPFLGQRYSFQTDSPASIWCYYTSFSSILASLMLFMHNMGFKID